MDLPRELVNHIAQGTCVVFVGAGLSQAAGLPSWTDLLREMLNYSKEHNLLVDAEQKELDAYVEEGELLLVAEEMRERLDKKNFYECMNKIFLKVGLKPTETHKLIVAIRFAAALTSNYDKLLESAVYDLANHVPELKISLPHVITHTDTPELASLLCSGAFYILKVHGTIDRIETIILSRNDYRGLIHANSSYRKHIEAILSTKHVLFIGFGLADPDLLLFMDELQISFRGYSADHYALMNMFDVPVIKQRRFEQDYGIHIIPYKPSGPDHPELRDFLLELLRKVMWKRKELKQVGCHTDPDTEMENYRYCVNKQS